MSTAQLSTESIHGLNFIGQAQIAGSFFSRYCSTVLAAVVWLGYPNLKLDYSNCYLLTPSGRTSHERVN
jgi:hypothetical protein